MGKKAVLFGLGVALLIAVIVSPFVSPWPDGLERVAEEKGFLEKGEGEPIVQSPVPGYAMPGVRSEKLATSAAGAVGTLIVFAATCGVAALLKRRKGRPRRPQEEDAEGRPCSTRS